jgi:hypothetical protein
MARYIDADNLKNIIEKATDRMVYINGVKAVDMGAITGLIDRQPTADVEEVVRCKDCRYWDGEGRCETPTNGITRDFTHPYDYCSYGERSKT